MQRVQTFCICLWMRRLCPTVPVATTLAYGQYFEHERILRASVMNAKIKRAANCATPRFGVKDLS